MYYTFLSLATDAVLTVKNLFNSTKEVTDWFTMGLQLDIEHPTLQRIAADKDSLDSRKQEMLHVWTQSDPDISWDKLSGALQNMGHRRLSIEIKKRQTILESRGINNTHFWQLGVRIKLVIPLGSKW